MLRPRIIPCLLIKNNGLVKTVNFKNPKYVGDPINAVRIFNEKKADELVVLDIDATMFSYEPDFKTIKNLATECRMPLCYGGGIKTVEQIEEIVGLGVEKVAISSSAIQNPMIISESSKVVGSQSIAVVLDVKKKVLGNGYNLFTHNGTKRIDKKLEEQIVEIERYGAGEIIINSIDRDGVMNGYDLKLVSKVKDLINIPITVIGGCGSLEDMEKLTANFGSIGLSAGSLFVFKGRYKAVLINYPSQKEKDKIINRSRSQS